MNVERAYLASHPIVFILCQQTHQTVRVQHALATTYPRAPAPGPDGECLLQHTLAQDVLGPVRTQHEQPPPTQSGSLKRVCKVVSQSCTRRGGGGAALPTVQSSAQLLVNRRVVLPLHYHLKFVPAVVLGPNFGWPPLRATRLISVGSRAAGTKKESGV